MSVKRIYSEKQNEFSAEAVSLLCDIENVLQIFPKNLRILNRYDVANISEEVFRSSAETVFSESAVDTISYELPELSPDEHIFAVEYLPGQYDQRADSAEQCISLISHGNCERYPKVRTAKVYILSGVSPEEIAEIKKYIINPVESREASLELPDTIEQETRIPPDVAVLDGFINLDRDGLSKFLMEYGLAMDIDDIAFLQKYFGNTEKRDPTITEVRMIDTYWSDHCRHTTFLTEIGDVSIDSEMVERAFREYLELRREVYGETERAITLMDIATIGGKVLKKRGMLPGLDESEEINACSVKIKVKMEDDTLEDYLLMFKNETHNHPTEIEPFGGAATCLGGAIRDPLSGRAYVYQAMRVTGAGNPLQSYAETLPGKLPQRKIVTTAANGYSSYGNQIGLATGHVSEIYDDGYVAKRMEIGAVIGAVPSANVVRKSPENGDVIILLGGKTGRDGCGGATGSSKSHNINSLENCGAEVQKGNPLIERKIERLFRNPDVTHKIKRCNDFGAGGVSVAIGELADGLVIDLDKIPKKYDGLDGTELAISESQERMAVVASESDAEAFIEAAALENLEATVVAKVTDRNRLEMSWRGKKIVDLSRDFLNSNGAPKKASVKVESKPGLTRISENLGIRQKFKEMIADLNICSQKGLVERFDSTVGGNTVNMPFGGKYQLTPLQSMSAKIPVLDGNSATASVMSWGFNPKVSKQNPYLGAIYAVVESVARVIASGGRYNECYLTFQEYFPRLKEDPSRWGLPFASLLGALNAQISLGISAIGGKDSMSGSFEDIDVPPTLVSFAVSTSDSKNIISPEFKKIGSKIGVIKPEYDGDLPDFTGLKRVFNEVADLIESKKAISVWSLSAGGIAEGIAKMCFGNRAGFRFTQNLSESELFSLCYGGFVIEFADASDFSGEIIGETITAYMLEFADSDNESPLDLAEIQGLWEDKLETVFPTKTSDDCGKLPEYSYTVVNRISPSVKIAKPRVLIPIFPGTNCEYETAGCFDEAGAKVTMQVIKNLTASDVESSIDCLERLIDESQIIAIPGGFSGGDEPEGSAKFIVSFFRNPRIKEATHRLLQQRDGLMLGICNGFQALIKLGLVPYGEIVDSNKDSPTLTYNKIGRHQSMMVQTKVTSNKSPWLMFAQPGDIHTIAVSHGEGRFIASNEILTNLIENGQICTRYVDLQGNPTMDVRCNPNGSMSAVEGITSPDGRILGKMGHSERIGRNVCRNVPGDKNQRLFESAVAYFG